MENEDGFRIDLSAFTADVKFEKDVMGIRMNVDDFEEGEKFLISKGFRMVSQQAKMFETDSNKSAAYVSPSGVIIMPVKHKKGVG
ncbi:MAG: hypothetical protein IJT87_00925 [Ruminiclostridium sp.]|nr:hypothetical protein [Ruminiclostridium sp.]